MVKQIQIVLDNDEYNELLKMKGKRTWKKFLMEASKKEAEAK